MMCLQDNPAYSFKQNVSGAAQQLSELVVPPAVARSAMGEQAKLLIFDPNRHAAGQDRRVRSTACRKESGHLAPNW